MKILLLLLTLCPVVVFATTEAENNNNTVYYYHGVSDRFFASGEYSQALVSVIEREVDDNASYLIYRVLDDKGDRSYVVLLKKQNRVVGCVPDRGNNAGCAISAPDLVKVYVPMAGQSFTNIDEHNVTALKMQEAGWGHLHQHRTHHGYTKRSLFLNCVYPGLGRVNANFTIKEHDDGRSHLYVKGSVGSDTDGLIFVWKSKMKRVFTMP